ncbi:Lrp/AsnC family transcriptional regulator [Microbacterium lushaniae]|nr:Lrp/AsnC family transcriptional regulator [Microbacterium lushaniae]KAA9159855.1 Lrp/AsnC family transcriptional regulator [Microbacterium lushaniae]
MSLKTVRMAPHDVELVHALQINPRASFTLLGEALGMSATAVRRRWERLTELGIAWVTATPSLRFMNAGCIAFMEVQVQPGRREAVAERLSQEPAIAAVDLVAGPADLMLSLVAPDLPVLSHFMRTRVETIPGVVRTNSYFATRAYREGSGWRLDALTPGQIATLRPAPPAGVHIREFTAFDRDLLRLLGEDGRTSHAELAERLGTSPASVRRRMGRLVASNAVSIRCDVSAPDFGWPVSVYLSASVAPGRLSSIANAIAQLPGIRLVTTTSGSVNLFIGAWLRTIEAISMLEERIGSIYPEWMPVNRTVVLESRKRAGRLIDATGRAIGKVDLF